MERNSSAELGFLRTWRSLTLSGVIVLSCAGGCTDTERQFPPRGEEQSRLDAEGRCAKPIRFELEAKGTGTQTVTFCDRRIIVQTNANCRYQAFFCTGLFNIQNAAASPVVVLECDQTEPILSGVTCGNIGACRVVQKKPEVLLAGQHIDGFQDVDEEGYLRFCLLPISSEESAVLVQSLQTNDISTTKATLEPYGIQQVVVDGSAYWVFE